MWFAPLTTRGRLSLFTNRSAQKYKIPFSSRPLAKFSPIPRCVSCFIIPSVKLFIFIGTNVGASLGWAAGEPFGMMAAFIVSGIGSALGVYAGWWAARRWL